MKAFTLILVLALSRLASAQIVPPHVAHIGARVRIDLRNTDRRIGRLDGVTREIVTIQPCGDCAIVRLPRPTVQQIAVSVRREPSAPRTEALRLLGAVVGAGATLKYGARCTDGPCTGALLAIPAAIAGSLVGTYLGLHIRSDVWERARLP